ncbi:hypothetical protein SUDANB6_00024 [Streptomyces sp. enrichment culture]
MPTKTLQIPTADGRADAFAAFPDRGERHPGDSVHEEGQHFDVGLGGTCPPESDWIVH